MTHNLKVLGLALVAAFAMSAAAASAASADAFTSEGYPATVTGAHEVGAAADTLATTAGTVKCANAVYDGTLTGASTTLTLKPTFFHCSSLAGAVPTIVDVNDCDYLFHINTGASTTGTVDIVCPVGQEITVTSNENTETNLTTKCTIHIPPQNNIGGITYDNVGVGSTREIRVTINASGITYTHTAGTGLGACITSLGLQHNGTFTATDLLTGEIDPTGAHTGLFLTESAV